MHDGVIFCFGSAKVCSLAIFEICLKIIPLAVGYVHL